MKNSLTLVILVIVATSLAMCKSKDVVEKLDPIVYQIKLTDKAKIKTVLKDIPHTASDFTRSSPTENKWRVSFVQEGKSSKSINKDLLNHPSVIIAVIEKQSTKGPKNKNKETSGFIHKHHYYEY